MKTHICGSSPSKFCTGEREFAKSTALYSTYRLKSLETWGLHREEFCNCQGHWQGLKDDRDLNVVPFVELHLEGTCI